MTCEQERLKGNCSYSFDIYNSPNHALHFHKNYEIIYVIKGKALCNVNGKNKMIEADEFAFCFPNEIHSIKSIGEAKIWLGEFSADLIKEFAKCQKGKTGTDFCFRCSDPILKYLKEYLIKEEALDDAFLIKSCLYALCSEYLRQISLEESDSKQLSLMRSVLEYIDKSYKRNISLADLAESLGYDYFYFSKMFGKLFSMSFNEYLNIYRFNEACRMLTESDMTITSIAKESGFQSIRSFNNTFKKLAGVSPCEYRESYSFFENYY